VSGIGLGGSGGVSRNRLFALGIAFAVFFTVYLVHLISIQVIDGYFYRSRAQQVTRRANVIPAQRGVISDRNGTVLATSVDRFALDLNPAKVPRDEFQPLVSRLTSILDLTAEQIERRIPPRARNSHGRHEIKSGVSFETIAYIAERIDRFPGIDWRSQPKRHYPHGSSLAQVLGYVGEITPEELQVLYNRGYEPRSVLGKAGIEREYDVLLRGTDGRRVQTVDALGRPVSDRSDNVPPEPGNDLVLTIDYSIQELAERALGERSGAVVVLRPATGEVLALASYPSFDANSFLGAGGDDAFRRAANDPRSPFMNRAIQGEAPPASTFKTILATAALEEEVISTDDVIDAQPFYRLGNRVFREWGVDTRGGGFGEVNIHDALAQSSNYFFYTVGSEMLGVERIRKYAEYFGLGQPTGIDLPGERSGLVPSPEWKRETQGEIWVGGDTVNFSIGQGFTSVTPLQLANVMAMVANRGTIYRPYIVQEIRDPETNETTGAMEPEVLHQAPVDEEVFEEVARGLRQVVTEGTARHSVSTNAVESVGKTGTGEIGSDDRYHSWYAAYAPYEPENPKDQVVVVVQVDAGNEYEFWAPRATDLILHGIFKDQSYEEVLEDLNPWYM